MSVVKTVKSRRALLTALDQVGSGKQIPFLLRTDDVN